MGNNIWSELWPDVVSSKVPLLYTNRGIQLILYLALLQTCGYSPCPSPYRDNSRGANSHPQSLRPRHQPLPIRPVVPTRFLVGVARRDRTPRECNSATGHVTLLPAPLMHSSKRKRGAHRDTEQQMYNEGVASCWEDKIQ